VSIGETHALGGEAVEVGCGGFSGGMGNISNAHVIGEDEDDIGLVGGRGGERDEAGGEGEECVFHWVVSSFSRLMFSSFLSEFQIRDDQVGYGIRLKAEADIAGMDGSLEFYHPAFRNNALMGHIPIFAVRGHFNFHRLCRIVDFTTFLLTCGDGDAGNVFSEFLSIVPVHNNRPCLKPAAC